MKNFSTKQLKKNISNNTWYPHYANHKFTILELHLFFKMVLYDETSFFYRKIIESF